MHRASFTFPLALQHRSCGRRGQNNLGWSFTLLPANQEGEGRSQWNIFSYIRSGPGASNPTLGCLSVKTHPQHTQPYPCSWHSHTLASHQSEERFSAWKNTNSNAGKWLQRFSDEPHPPAGRGCTDPDPPSLSVQSGAGRRANGKVTLASNTWSWSTRCEKALLAPFVSLVLVGVGVDDN